MKNIVSFQLRNLVSFYRWYRLQIHESISEGKHKFNSIV